VEKMDLTAQEQEKIFSTNAIKLMRLPLGVL
jgi:hypothetical protein